MRNVVLAHHARLVCMRLQAVAEAAVEPAPGDPLLIEQIADVAVVRSTEVEVSRVSQMSPVGWGSPNIRARRGHREGKIHAGALNLVSGQTHGFHAGSSLRGDRGRARCSAIPSPPATICDTRDTSTSVDPNNRNVGDLLNEKGDHLGLVQRRLPQLPADACKQGGRGEARTTFRITSRSSSTDRRRTSCTRRPARSRRSATTGQRTTSTTWSISGRAGRWHPSSGRVPQGAAYQDGHAGYSDPLDEQEFLVSTLNRCNKRVSGRTSRW